MAVEANAVSASGRYASYWNAFLIIFLLPTNEVLGKVIFSEVWVSHSVHRMGCMAGGDVWQGVGGA